MVERTLEGERLIVYVLMKILKKITGADVTSYLVKYAVNEMLGYFRPENIPLASALKRVLSHRYMQGKFEGVAKPLADRGVTKITIEENGLRFTYGEFLFLFNQLTIYYAVCRGMKNTTKVTM